MLKISFGLIIFLLAIACMAPMGSAPPCYHDKGIKLATTYAFALSTPENEKVQIIEYDELGRPLKRKQIEGEITRYVYDGINLKSTLINDVPDFKLPNSVFDSFSMDFSYIGESDTSWVTSNDEFGRPLEMRGADGNVLYMEYVDCAKEKHDYKDASGGLIFQYEIFKMDGLPQQTIVAYGGDDENKSVVKYFDYKVSEGGHWIERKYNYRENDTILEKRELILY